MARNIVTIRMGGTRAGSLQRRLVVSDSEQQQLKARFLTAKMASLL